MKEKTANQLIEETSPYLLQHAFNPVEWYSWEKGIEKAKESQKPLLISIGYSSCHWCHVMEDESFEDPETASLMNKLFINIKIDREERPDLDSTYQAAVARLSGGRGGWPLTVFATPDGNAFAGGTYFPKTSSYGLPSFNQVISYIHEHYTNNPDQITKIVDQTEAALLDIYSFSPNDELDKIEDTIKETMGRLSKDYDSVFGGFGFQPKFPQIPDLRFLLSAAHQMPEKSTIMTMVTNTIDHFAAGGIYDHLGFGFHRYSVDRKWLIPHFEKMLYDNAQMLLLYVEAYQATANERYAEIAKELVQYLEREMLSPESMFYSSQDADSEGKEGTYFVWDKTEIIKILGKEEGATFCEYFGVTSEGNFEGRKSVLHETNKLREAIQQELTTRNNLTKLKEKLFTNREKREKPFLNDNIITSWNAITIFALARASFILQDEKYLQLAEDTMRNVLDILVEPKSGHLHRTYRGEVKGWGFSEDYLLIIQACLELFAVTGKKSYLEQAIKFQVITDELFWDEQRFGYYFTSSLQTDTIAKEKPVVTFSIPNANSVALDNLIRFYHYTGENMYLERADKQAKFILGYFQEYGVLTGEALLALSLYKNKPTEIIVFEEKALYFEDKINDYLSREYIPESLYLKITKENFNDLTSLPLVQARLDSSDKYPFKENTAYICKDLTCSVPLKNGTEVDLYLHHSNE